MAKLKVGIIGATGTVGQRMIQLLERHPWFAVSAVAASDNSAGKNYAQATRWMLETPIPESVAKMTVQSCQPGLDCDFVLSGLPSSVAEEPELQLAKAGMPVLSMVVGPVTPCGVLDYKFRVLSHNTIRGAAGAAILNAELMYRKGLIG
jgi:aspartate-semialdehyde dehydrogenase